MYADLIEWLVFLNNNPKFRMNEDYMKPIQNAYKFMNQIASIIEKAEKKLKDERTEIENALMEQLRRFQAKIDEVQTLVKAYNDNNMIRKAAEYNKEIVEINEDLKYLKAEMKRVHEQQSDLEMMPGEYPQIEEMNLRIKPFEELWKL